MNKLPQQETRPEAIDNRRGLSDLLRHCPAGTVEAVLRLRDDGDPTQLHRAVCGIVARYAGRGMQARLGGVDALGLRLVEDLGLDSLSLMEIALLAEDALGLHLGPDDLSGLRTLEDLRRLVAGKLAVAAAR